jgi:protein ImuB
MDRYLSIYFPHWSIEQYRFRKKELSTTPILLTHVQKGQAVVLRMSAEAAKQGVSPGMVLPLALARCPQAQSFAFDPQADFQALYRLALQCIQFTPLIMVDPEYVNAYRQRHKTPTLLYELTPLHTGIILDLKGVLRTHGGELAFYKKFSTFLVQSKATFTLGNSFSLGAAWGLARFHTTFRKTDLLTPQTALKALPLQALRLPSATTLRLEKVGIQRIGQLLTFPRETLNLRFGEIVLTQLDKFFGKIPEPIPIYNYITPLKATQHFDPPLWKREAVVMGACLVLKKLCKRLAREALEVRALLLEFFGYAENGSYFQRMQEVALFSATLQSEHLQRLIEPIVAELNFPGDVEAITITALSKERAHALQRTLKATPDSTDEAHTQSAYKELMNNLVTRLGREKIQKLVTQASYTPECSAAFASEYTQQQNRTPLPTGLKNADRPSVLFQPPTPARAICMLPDLPPAKLWWKEEELRIVTGVGPERIGLEWWHATQTSASAPSQRDYFKLQDHTGRWLWVYRCNKTQAWFVQGVWG